MEMGKVTDKVKNLMPKGDVIACDVPADYAITAGIKLKVCFLLNVKSVQVTHLPYISTHTLTLTH